MKVGRPDGHGPHMQRNDRKYQWLEVHKILWTFVVIFFFPWIVILVSPRWGVLDWLQLLLILGSIAGIFLGYGAISSDRAYRRLDFVLALPFVREDVFWRKLKFRATLLLALILGSTALMMVGEALNREPLPPAGLFVALLALVLAWNLGLFCFSFGISALSDSPLKEGVRAVAYSLPVYVGFVGRYDEYFWNRSGLEQGVTRFSPEVMTVLSALFFAVVVAVAAAVILTWSFRRFQREELI